VASLARPGGNLTGLSFMSPELSAKRVEMLVAGFPGARCLAALWNPTDPVYALELERTERAASSFGLTLLPIAVRSHADFEAAFVEIGRKQADALIVFAHTLTILHRHRLIELANRHRLPTMYGLAEYGSDGGLISYGPRLADSFRRSAYYVDRILKGASPADLPIEQPTKLQLVINLKTAATLGLNIPPSLLPRPTR
jgi:putative ABC transport system substrate-binding protein